MTVVTGRPLTERERRMNALAQDLMMQVMPWEADVSKVCDAFRDRVDRDEPLLSVADREAVIDFALANYPDPEDLS